MQNRWNDTEAAACGDDPLAMRVYTSRLIGADEDLVLHGGGNTSVKLTAPDALGRPTEALAVKGSGWDLATIAAPGFPLLRLDDTRALADRETLGDDEMAAALRNLMLDQSGPNPSVEAILHALIPRRFVDHTHTDAVVTISNTVDGDRLIAELYPDCLVLPYIMPGFILAKQVRDAIAGVDLDAIRGIVLLHHGVFTFDDDARASYGRMIELVDRAERFIAEHRAWPDGCAPDRPDNAIATPVTRRDDPPTAAELLGLARIRQAVSHARGFAQLARLEDGPAANAFARRDDLESICARGPITPDHVIRTKRIPVVLPDESVDAPGAVERFVADYHAYFAAHAAPEHVMLDPAPRWGAWSGHGTLAFGTTPKECGIVADIARHTTRAIQVGEALGGWRALPQRDLFELEYWVLEQAKLAKAGGQPRPHRGKVALVSGAAGGIGRACVERLRADGAVVVGLDRDPAIVDAMQGADLLGIECDVTDDAALRAATHEAVRQFGGLDLVVLNAGIFRTGATIDAMTSRVGEHDGTRTWDDTMRVNLTASQRLMAETIPFLRLGVDPSIVVIGSRNVAAPGPGAGAYSASKAALTQLARVAALELASDGVRVNVIHPDAVFDTGIWTEEALARSAERYGLTVAEYRTKNLLGRELRSADVAAMVSTVAGPVFAATTGAQIPIDGGNDRVV